MMRNIVENILPTFQPDIKKVVELFRPQPEDDLHKRTKTRDFGFSVERLPYGTSFLTLVTTSVTLCWIRHAISNTQGSFAIGEYVDVEAMDYLQLMHSSIYYEYTLAYTVRMWPLRDALNTLITRVVQSGIQSMWEWRVKLMQYVCLPFIMLQTFLVFWETVRCPFLG